MLKGLGIGRIVLSKRDGFPSDAIVGGHRPAIVVNNWPELNRDDGYSNLLLFLDCANDQPGTESVYPGTWHWRETV